jgi:predicted enzyme related to lactoylglutathione lyase
MIEHVAFVMYPVTDMERAAAFYERGLGLRRDGLDSPVWIEFDVAGTTFGIGNFEQVGKPGTANALAIEVADMDAVRARLTEQGFTASEPYELPNCFLSVVQDPDGNNVWLHKRKAAS